MALHRSSAADEDDVWAELDRVLSEADAPSPCEQILPRAADLARSLSAPIHRSEDDKHKTKPAQASVGPCEQPRCSEQTWVATSTAAATPRKPSRQFLIQDLDEASCNEASLSTTADREAADASEVALSRCPTASVSPRGRQRAFSVQDFDSAGSESVCNTNLNKLGLCRPQLGLTLEICVDEADARHKVATPTWPQQWAADVDPDLLVCSELRSAISLLQERVRQLERMRCHDLKAGRR